MKNVKPLKILTSFGERPGQESEYLETLSICNSQHFLFESINHRKELGIIRAWDPLTLDQKYRNKDINLLILYEKILNLCENYDVFIVENENVYHPDFIKKLSLITYTVLYSSDDPESSFYASQPYAFAFDHILYYSVYYDENIKMDEKFKEWGAKRANYRPYGWQETQSSYGQCVGAEVYNENFIFNQTRDIDVIYVGGPYNKTEALLKIKKKFGRKFKLYGDWGAIKDYISRIRKYGSYQIITKLGKNDLIKYYRRAKIGINMHMSFGPSNLRTWQLPVNGVCQITDNPKGTSEIFELNKEIICYENGSTDKAIELIDYYLKHDEERISIAKQGYRKVIKDYSYKNNLYRSLEHIKRGIKEKLQSQIQ